MTRRHPSAIAAGAIALVLAAGACASHSAGAGASTAPPPSGSATASAAMNASLGPARDVRVTSSRFMTSWNGEDPATLGAFFTSDAIVTAGDSTYRGSQDVQTRWLTPALPVMSDLSLTNQVWEGSGSTIFESGSYRYTATVAGQSAQPVGGTYKITWVRQPDGTWRARTMVVTPGPSGQ